MNNDTTRKDLLEQVKNTIKNVDSDTEPLDVEYRIDGNFNLKEIILTVTTGGSRIDIHLNSYLVKGYWGGEIVEYPIFEKEAKTRSHLDSLFYQYKEIFDSNLTPINKIS